MAKPFYKRYCMQYVVVLIICFAYGYAKGEVMKYYVNGAELSEYDYNAIDRTFVRVQEKREHADTIFHIMELDIYSRIDTVSIPGRLIVVKRSEEEISKIKEAMNEWRVNSALYKVGDKLPDHLLTSYLSANNSSISIYDTIQGKVALLNFWATWCGPCIKELEGDGILSVIRQFDENKNFVFIPISVNHNKEELDDFFNSERGKGFDWLARTTLCDYNGKFSDLLSEGAIPITILVDEKGVIRLNESGAFLSNNQIEKLKEQIYISLRTSE